MGAETILSALRRAAQITPSGNAIRYIDPDDLDFDDAAPVVLSHAALMSRIIALANAYRALSGKERPVVTVFAPSNPDGVVALLAAMVAGTAHPVNFYLSAEDIRESMQTAGTDIAISPGPSGRLPCWSRLQDAIKGMPHAPHVVVCGRKGPLGDAPSLHALISQFDGDRLSGDEQQPDMVAALFNTAGTTGRSKLVPLSHRNLLASARGLGLAWEFSDQTRIVNALPFFHVAGANLLLLGPLIAGAEVMLLSETGLRNQRVLERHWQIVERYTPSIIGGIPSSLIALLDVPLNGARIDSVRFCATGGAPMPEVSAAEFQRRFGLTVHSIYGMTECAGLISTAPAGEAPDYHCVGRPADGVDIRIRALATDGLGVELGPDQPGVICVRAEQVFAGYLGKAGDPGLAPEGWLATGDIGCLRVDGQLRITGRAKDVIIRSGNNIDPVVIETAALAYPDVQEAAAVAMPDHYAGEVPVLFVVPRAGVAAGVVSSLEAHLRGVLAEPHAMPMAIIALDKLPLTSVGKLSRVELRRMAAEHAVKAVIDGLGAVQTAPRVIRQDDGQLEVILPPGADERILRAIRELGLTCAAPTVDAVVEPAQT